MTSIPTRERCAACQHISSIGFWVPDEMWAIVVHPHFQNSVLCVQCFISRADEKLIDWSAAIRLYPVSLANHLRETRGLLAKEIPHEPEFENWWRANGWWSKDVDFKSVAYAAFISGMRHSECAKPQQDDSKSKTP